MTRVGLIGLGAMGSRMAARLSTVGPAAVLRLRSALPAATGLLDAPVAWPRPRRAS